MPYFVAMNFYEKSLGFLGFSDWTFIQKESIRNFKSHEEIIFYAPTGSGKTLAFLLPIIEALTKRDNTQGLLVLIFAPTRELALQIEQVFKSLKSEFGITACYGGHPVKTERKNLSANPSVVVGTPGRIADHLRRGNINVESVEYFVIDEFDKCLEIGFLKEMEEVYAHFTSLKKSVFCSATRIELFPSFIKFLNPAYIDVIEEMQEPDISYYKLDSERSRLAVVKKLIESFNLEPAILFCNFREEVDGLLTYFEDHGIAVTAYHGGMEQNERERSLIKFKNGSAPLLICTDLGARGLDVEKIKHIVHFQFPEKEDAFIHRNGRTARMSENGSVYVFEEDAESANFSLPQFTKVNFKHVSEYMLPQWTTVYFSAGKKDKINKVDLLGFICQKGGIEKTQIGMISVLDNTSYVAIQSDLLPELLPELRKYKIKGQKIRISISK